MTKTSLLASLFLASAMAAQFEVASIKPSDPSAPRGGRFAPPPIDTKPGMLTARSASLKQLIEAAWGIEDYQVSGGPAWITTDGFDIMAKPAGPADRDQMLLMLRDLLTSRFRLALHHETKELAVYALVVAKNGPKFHAVKAGEDSGQNKTNHMRPGNMAYLARFITHLGADKPVIDKTGQFDLDLDMQKIMEAASADGAPPTPEKMLEALTNMLPDRYGLRLTSAKTPVQIFVIDKAEKPSGNRTLANTPGAQWLQMPRYAAVDIGSNSVRMEAAEVADGSTRVLASDREVTRLGESVFKTGRFTPESIALVCGVLTRMAALYKRLDITDVRAVATAAVRDAGNQHEFVVRASAALGAPVEIISGQEEARLIDLGVRTHWPHPSERFLIVDIGGGSAEVILSEPGGMKQAFSRPLGALRLQEVFLKSDPPQAAALHRLEEYIAQRLRAPVLRMQQHRIDRMIGTSATASAVVCAANRIPRSRRDEANGLRATTAQVRRLYNEVSVLDTAARQRITGIGPRRAEIIVPGTAVLLHVLEALDMPAVYYSTAGVRDGIIADLAARDTGSGFTQLTVEQRQVVERMAEHYGVPLRHGRKVARLAGALFGGLRNAHRLPPFYGRLLEAAAYLHDVGHYVSDTRHHEHSYYLVSNSDMPGFTAIEREIVANLCRYHRKAVPTQEHGNLQPLDADSRRAVTLLMPLLRLADSLDRSQNQHVRSLECTERAEEFQVTILVPANVESDLEVWAAEQLSDLFRQVYGKGLAVRRGVSSDAPSVPA
jgi:exopolyphosphatase/guanosine-5'-triphosphate,3'-diphosphate pyrophosphatase